MKLRSVYRNALQPPLLTLLLCSGLLALGCGPVDSNAAPADAAPDACTICDALVLPDVLVFDASPPDPTADVHVIITGDNAYGFGYGDEQSLANYFGGVENNTAGEIFNCPVGNGPEGYTVPALEANAGKILYIVAYADSATTQGVIGQFKRDTAASPTVYTGEGAWEVCATGVNFSPGSSGPTLQEVNEQIALCNAGASDPATTSVGWVDATGNGIGALAVGEDNTTPRTTVEVGNEFPVVCGLDEEAKWMWYNWDPTALVWPTTGSPFIWPSGTSGNPDKQFLIFRLFAEDIPIVL